MRLRIPIMILLSSKLPVPKPGQSPLSPNQPGQTRRSAPDYGKLLIFHVFGARSMRLQRIISCLTMGAALARPPPPQALERLCPPAAKRGTLSGGDFPTVRLTGTER
jgi:hypothetical protein